MTADGLSSAASWPRHIRKTTGWLAANPVRLALLLIPLWPHWIDSGAALLRSLCHGQLPLGLAVFVNQGSPMRTCRRAVPETVDPVWCGDGIAHWAASSL